MAAGDVVVQALHLAEAERRLDVGHAVVEAELDLLVVPGAVGLACISVGSRVMPWLRRRAMRSASSASLVVAMPPSPVVMILTGWKLKTVMSL